MLGVDDLARAAELHPDLVRRLVVIGVLECDPHQHDEPLVSPAAVLRLRRIARLHRDLGLAWSGLGLAVDLMERIDVLEARIRLLEGVE